MKSGLFVALCLGWAADMAALAAIGPLGRHAAPSMALYGGGFILMMFMVRFFPEHLKTSQALALIMGLGIAARSAFLFFPPNTDIYRYIWEGAVQNHGFNPYLFPPDDPALAFLAQGELSRIWQELNHKSFAAVYPPAAMLLFRLLAWISPTPLLFKAAFLIVDIGVMAVLAALLRARRLLAARLLLYAGNPLAVVFVSGEGHLDVLQVFLLFVGLFLWANRSSTGGYLFLGLAVMSKYLAAAAVPFFWRRRCGWRLLALFAPAALFIPYLSAGWSLFESLGVFTTRMQYNDVITQVLGAAFGPWWLPAAGFLFMLCLGWVWLVEDDRLRGIYLGVGCLLVMLPTLHPWYLLMIAPFMCFFPSAAWLYLQAAVLFTFPVLGQEFQTGVFREIPWLKLPEYLPFFALLAWGLFKRGSVLRVQRYDAPQTISVITPALNEAENIVRLLTDLKGRPWIKEIIVADGGSTDATAAAAREFGVPVITGGRGRGVQVRAAAQAAGGDVLLILHADASLHPGATERIVAALSADREAAGGWFAMQFRDSSPGQALIATLNNLRGVATGISFGDQAQFVRADALKRIGGFPDLMLMEDVELSLRLKPVGGCVCLGPGVTVSGRRWQAGKFTRNIWTVGLLFFRYLLERRLGWKADDKWYYRKYYRGLV
jgi:rSAM/selenodomain-associated transferase 2